MTTRNRYVSDDEFEKRYDREGWEHRQLIDRLDRNSDLLEQLIKLLSGRVEDGKGSGRLQEVPALELKPAPERRTPAPAITNGKQLQW